jgi:hypothetical protein
LRDGSEQRLAVQMTSERAMNFDKRRQLLRGKP